MGQLVDDALVAALSRFDTALEVGIGRRTTAAAQLAAGGTTVVAIDVDSDVVGDVPDSVAFVEADVRELAGAADPIGDLRERATKDGSGDSVASGTATGDGTGDGPDSDAQIPPAFDLVYALNLPAELQRPTAELAERLDAICAFTTLGFEEPVVDVSRKTVGNDTLYVANDRGSDVDWLDSGDR